MIIQTDMLGADEIIHRSLGELVDISVARIKQFEPVEGYYICFSGGKDSMVIKALADRAGVKYDIHYNNTTIDPPDLTYFRREFYPNVIIQKPVYSFFGGLLKHGYPLRHRKWCCHKLKESGGMSRDCMTGIRWQESNRRRGRKMHEAKMNDKSKHFIHPIIDWDSEDIWEFIYDNNLPYCNLYDEGFTRIGCMLCPAQSFRFKKKEIKRWPRIVKNFERAFVRLYEKRKHQPNYQWWECGEELFRWWLVGNEHPSKKANQIAFIDTQGDKIEPTQTNLL